MFLNVLGGTWFAMGLMWLLRPEWLRMRVGKKMRRRVTWPLSLMVFFIMSNLLGIAIRVPGVVYKLVSIVCVVMLAKVLWALVSKTSSRFLEWWSELPLIVFRGWAVICMGTGLWIIFFR